jgi:hypothetical protein
LKIGGIHDAISQQMEFILQNLISMFLTYAAAHIILNLISVTILKRNRQHISLGHYAIRRKVVGSIPDKIIVLLNLLNLYRRNYGPEVDLIANRNKYLESS